MKTIRSPLLACLLAVVLVAATRQPLMADDDQSYSVWSYSFYKTISYEALARAADIPIYYLVGGGGGSTLAFTAVNVGTGAAVYYLFEVAWNLYGTSVEGQPADQAIEIGARKTIVFRLVATVRKLALGYAFTGSAIASFGFALISNVASSVIYVVNEYGWYRFGPPLGRGQAMPNPPSGDVGSAAMSAVEGSVAYIADLTGAAESRLAGEIANAVSDLRQRL